MTLRGVALLCVASLVLSSPSAVAAPTESHQNATAALYQPQPLAQVSAAFREPPTDAIEGRLGAGATGFLRTVRRLIRGVFRVMFASARRWVEWSVTAIIFVAVALTAPLLDRAVLRTWRRDGFKAFRRVLALSLAVYVRLLIDRRSPLIGKGLLILALAYGVAARDLVPGVFDDLVVVVLAARCFTGLCPDRLVEEHAVRASKARERTLRRRAARAEGHATGR